jgi:hypothetical protein
VDGFVVGVVTGMVVVLCADQPYQLQYSVAFRDNMREILGPASELAEKYSTYSSRVALSCLYKQSLGITCLSKVRHSSLLYAHSTVTRE